MISEMGTRLHTSSYMRRLLGVLSLLPILACAAGSSESPEGSVADLETAAAISGQLASCTVTEAGDATAIACTRRSDLPTEFLVVVKATAANGTVKSLDLRSTTTASDRLYTAFPLRLEVTAIRKASSNAAQALEQTEIRQTYPVAAFTTTPIDVRLPYDFWPVTVVSTSSAPSVLTVARRALDIAPWTLPQGGSSASIAELGARSDTSAPAKVILAVPPGTKTLPVSLRLGGRVVEAVIDGPGSFYASDTGLSRSAPPTVTPGGVEPTDFGDEPMNVIACHTAPADRGAGVFCSTRTLASVTTDSVIATLLDATGKIVKTTQLSGAGDFPLGTCTKAPCSVDGSARFTVGRSSVSGTVTLPITEAPARLRAPFDAWTFEADYRGKRVIVLDLAASEAAPPSGWSELSGLGTYRAAATASATFAVPAGTTALAAKLTVLDVASQKLVPSTATVQRGVKYVVGDDLKLAPAR